MLPFTHKLCFDIFLKHINSLNLWLKNWLLKLLLKLQHYTLAEKRPGAPFLTCLSLPHLGEILLEMRSLEPQDTYSAEEILDLLNCLRNGFVSHGTLIRGIGLFCTDLSTQQNFYSISHLQGTVTVLWLDSDCVATVENCQQHSDWAANDSVVTVLLAVVNSDCVATVENCQQHSDLAANGSVVTVLPAVVNSHFPVTV